MTAKRSDHLKPTAKLLACTARCLGCDWQLIAPSNGPLSAERHAKTHHHHVIMLQSWSHIFDGRPESEKPGL